MPTSDAPFLGFPIGGIEDGVVRLRLRSDADVPRIIEACRDPEIPRWTRIPEGYDLKAAREFAQKAYDQAASGAGLALVVADAETDALLGSCGLVKMVAEEQRCEIGYWLAPWARGRGVMTRSVRLLCRWLFDELDIQRIAAGAEPANLRSQAVLERAGFQREGIIRSLYEDKGRRRDFVCFSLLPGELDPAG